MIGRGTFGSEPNTSGVSPPDRERTCQRSLGSSRTLTHRTKVPGAVATNGLCTGAPAPAAGSLGRGTRPRVALAERLEQEDRARNGGVERTDRAAHRDADEQVAPAPDRGAQAVA